MTDEPDPAPQAPATAAAAAVAETHSAVVFFFGDRAYKVKKSVDLGFLDFRRRETREVVCHREVELNRRLAADVYLGVADVYDPDGQVNDHLVVMRRMPVERRLFTLITSGQPVEGDLRMLARVMAAFHAAAERSPAADRAASPEALAQRWTDSTAALEELASGAPPGTASLVGHIQGLAMRYLAGRSHLFDTRIADGRTCDGHGDLLADDIFCLDDGPRVLETMLSWAPSGVSMGETVVLDASWTDHLWRDRAHELARQQAAELV